MNAGLARLRLAAQDADMTRCNDRLVLLVDQRIPAALLVVQRATEDGLHAIAGPYGLGHAFRVVPVLKHITRRHGGDGPIPKFALPQGLLRLYAVRDLHEETNHPRGPAIGI